MQPRDWPTKMPRGILFSLGDSKWLCYQTIFWKWEIDLSEGGKYKAMRFVSHNAGSSEKKKKKRKKEKKNKTGKKTTPTLSEDC